MTDRTTLINVRLIQPVSGSLDRSDLYKIVIQSGQVHSIEPMTASADIAENSAVLNIGGDSVSLGAIDLQINGALGLAFPDLRPQHFEQLQRICDWLWQQGIDGFCPTLVTTSLENFRGALSAIAEFQQQRQPHSAKILGVHLEGPFLNRAKRGAHPEEFLQPLSLENVKTLIGEFADLVSIVTLAPECEIPSDSSCPDFSPDFSPVIEWLAQRNIVVSLGHSLANSEQANRAFDQGATMVTHAFNAMPGLHHRKPGLLGAALADDRVFCGFIADGQHICPTMLDLLLSSNRGRLKPSRGGLFLVSDALSPLGLPDGVYPWDTRQIEVANGTARLADGTLSGTTLPLIEGAQNLVRWELCGSDEAIALVTQAPRRAIGLPDLSVGDRANLLRWHQTPDGNLTWQRLNL